MISDLRKQYGDILLLDAGDFFWKKNLKELRASITVKAIKMMQYDVLNVSDGELRCGLAFLDHFTGAIQERLISSNIFKDNKYVFKPYALKAVNGVNVAVLGVVLPGLIKPQQAFEDQIEIRDPESTLRALLPQLKKEVDIVVVLSHMGWDQSVQLANNVDNLDFIIVGHDYYPTFDPVTINETVLLKSSVGGKHLGEIKMWLDSRKKLQRYESTLIELSSKINIYPEYTLPEKEFEKKSRWLKRSIAK